MPSPSAPASKRMPHQTAASVFSDLVDLLYTAATEPQAWTPFLTQLTRATDSAFAVMLVQDTAGPGGDCLWQFGLPQEAVRAYPDWAPHNVIMKAALPLMRTGALFPNAPVSRSEVLRSSFYNDWLCHFARVVDATGACIVYAPPVSMTLSCNRLISKRDYGPAEHLLIRGLLPHLQRAFSIHQRLGRAELQTASSEAALDALWCGVMLLDDRGKILFANRAARKTFKDDDGLVLNACGELRAAGATEQVTLQRLIGQACATGNGAVDDAGGAVRVRRPSSKRPYALIVAPLRLRQFPLLPRRPAAVVFVTDPEAVPQAPADQVARLFDLTPAEARLAVALAAGRTLEEHAEGARITIGTARWTLRQVLEKTGCRRQSELVSLILRSAAGVGDPAVKSEPPLQFGR